METAITTLNESIIDAYDIISPEVMTEGLTDRLLVSSGISNSPERIKAYLEDEIYGSTTLNGFREIDTTKLRKLAESRPEMLKRLVPFILPYIQTKLYEIVNYRPYYRIINKDGKTFKVNHELEDKLPTTSHVPIDSKKYNAELMSLVTLLEVSPSRRLKDAVSNYITMGNQVYPILEDKKYHILEQDSFEEVDKLIEIALDYVYAFAVLNIVRNGAQIASSKRMLDEVIYKISQLILVYGQLKDVAHSLKLDSPREIYEAYQSFMINIVDILEKNEEKDREIIYNDKYEPLKSWQDKRPNMDEDDGVLSKTLENNRKEEYKIREIPRSNEIDIRSQERKKRDEFIELLKSRGGSALAGDIDYREYIQKGNKFFDDEHQKVKV